MIELYAAMVMRGLRPLTQVPARYREKVYAWLVEAGSIKKLDII